MKDANHDATMFGQILKRSKVQNIE